MFWAALSGIFLEAGAGQRVSVSGRVVNRTRNAPVTGQEVTLDQGGAAEQVKAVTGADGAFRFTGVAVEDSAALVLMTSYLGAPYVVPDVAVKDRAASDVEVAVYDTTSSDAAVRSDAYHLIVNAHGPAMEVMEILSLQNTGDRTIYNAGGASLRAPLPSGFSGLEAESSVVVTPEGVASQWPVLPGPARLRFRYKMPEGDAFSCVVPYPASMVSVLIHPADLSVESRSLQVQGPVDFEGQKFLHLTGSSLARGSVIDFRITGRGVAAGEVHAPEGERWRETLKWTLFGLAVILGAAAWFYRPRKRQTADRAAERDGQERLDGWRRQTADYQGVEQGGSTAIHRRVGGDAKRLEDQRAETLGQIAALDDDREAGRVDEATYRERRAALKADAVRLTEALRSGDV